MIELYHWEPNLFYLKPLIALHEKGIPFASHWIDPTALGSAGLPELSPEARNNPEINGPILVDRGETIVESFFMLEYIDEAYPTEPMLLPGDPLGNWQVRVWGRFLGERTAPAISTLGCHRYLARGFNGWSQTDIDAALARFPRLEERNAWAPVFRDSYGEEELAESRRKATDAVNRVEAALAGGEWLLGERYTLADIEAFALFNPLPELAPDLCSGAVAPRTTEWLFRMRQRPAVKAALAHSKSGLPTAAFAPGPEHARWG
jgi:glutathione S-transferase